MNIIGIIFSFLLPGILIGMLISAAVEESYNKESNSKETRYYSERVEVVPHRAASENRYTKTVSPCLTDEYTRSVRAKSVRHEVNQNQFFFCTLDESRSA